MVHARNKGKDGEREFIQLFGQLWPSSLKRNLDQVRDGGSDIVGCDPFVIEVKRVEKLDLNSWWFQVKVAASATESTVIPCVAYRQSRQPWRFLLPANLIVDSEGYMIVDMECFIKFVSKVLESNGLRHEQK